jgi:hypothetical protein
MDKKQHAVGHQSSQREDLHSEKSASCQHRKLSPNEFCLRRRALALRRRWYAVATQNIADGLIRNLVAEIDRCPSDLVIAPGPVLLAMRTIRSSMSLPMGGLPGVLRAGDPSNLRATSLRYHPKMVSGRAAVASSPSALRLSRWPISPSVARSEGAISMPPPLPTVEASPASHTVRGQLQILMQLVRPPK